LRSEDIDVAERILRWERLKVEEAVDGPGLRFMSPARKRSNEKRKLVFLAEVKESFGKKSLEKSATGRQSREWDTEADGNGW
jgi:hypothetical protein